MNWWIMYQNPHYQYQERRGIFLKAITNLNMTVSDRNQIAQSLMGFVLRMVGR